VETKRLLLTECIIDAASLLQQEAIAKDHSILALYGTNGLTKEHLSAIKSLKYLEEITFFLDGDEAGQEAVKSYAQQLSKLLPKVRLMNILPLENEDINSISRPSYFSRHGGKSKANSKEQNPKLKYQRTKLKYQNTNPKP